jgi:Tfp pilus assembly protein PilN
VTTRPDGGRAPSLALPGTGLRVGLALDAAALCAVDLRAPRAAAWERAIAPLAADAAAWPALADALRELMAARGAHAGELSVALMPGLAQLRRVELPPLRADELRRLLARNAPRWFLGAREPQVTAAEVAPARGAAARPVVAAAASTRLVEAVHEAARQAGWTVRTIVPAEAAWRAAALALWPSLARGAGDVLVHQASRTSLLQLDAGRLVGLRHLRPGVADAGQVRDALAERAASGPAGPSVSLAALGEPERRAELSRALAAHGVTPALPATSWRELADAPARLAAAFAARGAGLELVPESLRVARRGRASRTTGLLLGVALLLLAVAAALELWGVRRELAAVQGRRAELRARVAGVAAERAATERRLRQAADLAGAERGATRWTALFAVLAEHLPEDAYVVAVRGQADSVVVEGLAASAASALEAVERAPGVAGVRTAAPVRADLDAAEGAERFTFAARLAPPVGPRP